MTDTQTAHRAGIWIMVLSAVLFSTAGLFTKGVGAGAWDVIFWRALFAGIITLTMLGMGHRLRSEWSGMGASGWAAAVIGAVATAMFIAAFKTTTVANVALIYATVPLLAAALAWLFLREVMGVAMLLGALGALAGVAVLVSGSLGGVHLRGDLLALGMTLGIGAVMVIYRAFPQTPTALPMVLSGALLLPVAFLAGDPLAVPLREVAILGAFAAVFALAAVLLAEGSKRVPSGQAALLGALEAPLAPVWAWVILGETPGGATWLGGAIILMSVVGAQLFAGPARRR